MQETQKKQILGNTVYTMGGMLLMNGVLQLLIYPLLNRHMGADQMGGLLYIMGLVSILCPSVGQALNTSRLVVRRTHAVENGDYNRSLLLFGSIGSVIAVLVSSRFMNGAGTVALTLLLLMLTMFRYYGDVEYRLNLNYRRFFIYYLVMSVGYIAGFGLYWLTDVWFLIFLTGEAASLVYVRVTGSVFRRFFVTSDCFKVACSRGFFLMLSYLITNVTLNMDRVALKYMIGNVAVTQYYVVSLIGKTMVLLIAPVNTIVISYLTKREQTLRKKEFGKAVLAGAAVSLVFFMFCQIATPIFVKLLYPDLYEAVQGLVTVVNLTQVLGMFSAFLFILVLTFTGEKWQLILQGGHLILMTGLVLLLTVRYGMMGFSLAVLAANILRVLAVTILGFIKLKKQSNMKIEEV